MLSPYTPPSYQALSSPFLHLFCYWHFDCLPSSSLTPVLNCEFDEGVMLPKAAAAPIGNSISRLHLLPFPASTCSHLPSPEPTCISLHFLGFALSYSASYFYCLLSALFSRQVLSSPISAKIFTSPPPARICLHLACTAFPKRLLPPVSFNWLHSKLFRSRDGELCKANKPQIFKSLPCALSPICFHLIHFACLLTRGGGAGR